MMRQQNELVPMFRVECLCGAWRVANTDKPHVADVMLRRAGWGRRPVNGWTCPECAKVAATTKEPERCGTAGPV